MHPKRIVLSAPLLALGFGAMAQVMVLQTGQLTVTEGTTITLEGPLTWQVAPAATVINDGTIDLGATATLAEAPGAAITGSGAETTTRTLDGPLAGAEPGGLGLAFTHDQGLGTITVTRGHTPITTPSGSSIARWFALECAPAEGLELALRYDPTELNGLDPTTLVLHRFAPSSGYWQPLPGISDIDAHTVTGSASAPWERLTAFHADMTTDAGGAPSTPLNVRVHPTITTGPVWMEALQGVPITRVELFDIAGRRHAVEVALTGSTAHMDIGHLGAGAYVLRINGESSHRLVKP